jgi:hypothetical protein
MHILPLIAVTILIGCCLSMVGGAAQAEEMTISTIPDDAVPVATVTDLARVGTGTTYAGHVWALDAYYYLTQDITLTGPNNHVPIGTLAAPFTGTFDGAGHSISGIDISQPTAALFAYAKDADVCNLAVSGNIQCTSIGAGIIAYSSGTTTVYRTSFSGNLTGPQCGGIVGETSAGSLTVRECYNASTMISTSTTSTARLGGIVMYAGSYMLIADCYNTGSMYANTTGAVQVGGIVAACSGQYGFDIVNCINLSVISLYGSGTIYGGAIVASVVNMNNYDIFNCYYPEESITINGAASNSIVANRDNLSLDPGYASPSRKTEQLSGPKTVAQLKPSLASAKINSSIYYGGTASYNSAQYAGWDFTNTWVLDPDKNNGYPSLRMGVLGDPGGGGGGGDQDDKPSGPSWALLTALFVIAGALIAIGILCAFRLNPHLGILIIMAGVTMIFGILYFGKITIFGG